MVDQEDQQFLNELDKKLWNAADRLRSSLDAAVYKHAVLGLIFLKYVSDSFRMRQVEIEAALRDAGHDYFLDPADYGEAESEDYVEAIRVELEERDYYIEKNVFWVPALARWKTIPQSTPTTRERSWRSVNCSANFRWSPVSPGKPQSPVTACCSRNLGSQSSSCVARTVCFAAFSICVPIAGPNWCVPVQTGTANAAVG